MQDWESWNEETRIEIYTMKTDRVKSKKSYTIIKLRGFWLCAGIH